MTFAKDRQQTALLAHLLCTYATLPSFAASHDITATNTNPPRLGSFQKKHTKYMHDNERCRWCTDAVPCCPLTEMDSQRRKQAAELEFLLPKMYKDTRANISVCEIFGPVNTCSPTTKYIFFSPRTQSQQLLNLLRHAILPLRQQRQPIQFCDVVRSSVVH